MTFAAGTETHRVIVTTPRAPADLEFDLSFLGADRVKVRLGLNATAANVQAAVVALVTEFQTGCTFKDPPGQQFFDLDTFEEPDASLPENERQEDRWAERNGARPEYDITHACCGSRSLHMRDRGTWWGGNRGRNFGEGTFEVGQTEEGYDSDVFPWLCTAAKIPDGVQPVLLIHIRYVGWRSIVFDSKADFILNPGQI